MSSPMLLRKQAKLDYKQMHEGIELPQKHDQDNNTAMDKQNMSHFTPHSSPRVSERELSFQEMVENLEELELEEKRIRVKVEIETKTSH